MKTLTKSFLLLTFLLFGFATQIMAGVKWVVTDETLTVWDSPENINKLGVLHKGYEFEEKSVDGNKICFDYNGQNGYVAMHCCQKVDDVAASQAVEETTQEVTTAQAAAPSSDADLTEVSAVNAPADKVQKTAEADKLSSKEMAMLGGAMVLAIPLATLQILGIVFALFYAFKYDALRNWFNKRCGADCIPAGKINKLFRRLMLPAIVSSLVSFAGNFVNIGIIGSIVIVALPCFFLFKIYKEYNEKFGKTAALWTLLFSILTIYTIILLVALLMYVVFIVIALYAASFMLEETRPGGSMDIHNRSCSNCSKLGTSACPHRGQAGNGCCGSYS